MAETALITPFAPIAAQHLIALECLEPLSIMRLHPPAFAFRIPGIKGKKACEGLTNVAVACV